MPRTILRRGTLNTIRTPEGCYDYLSWNATLVIVGTIVFKRREAFRRAVHRILAGDAVAHALRDQHDRGVHLSSSLLETIALLRRADDVEGYVVYRHLREPHGRVTQIVDLIADPTDERGIKTLARWVDREARLDDSDKIRCYATHASLRRVLRRSGYFVVKSGFELTAKVNAVQVAKDFYESHDEWHFTLGDGELDH